MATGQIILYIDHLGNHTHFFVQVTLREAIIFFLLGISSFSSV